MNDIILVGVGAAALSLIGNTSPRVSSPIPSFTTQTTQARTYTPEEAKAEFQRLHRKIIDLRHTMNPMQLALSALETKGAYITRYPGDTSKQALATINYRILQQEQALQPFLDAQRELTLKKDALRRFF